MGAIRLPFPNPALYEARESIRKARERKEKKMQTFHRKNVGTTFEYEVQPCFKVVLTRGVDTEGGWFDFVLMSPLYFETLEQVKEFMTMNGEEWTDVR